MIRTAFAETRGGCGMCERPGGFELTDRALALARLSAGARVLDVGCGLGASVAHLVDHCGLRAVGLAGGHRAHHQQIALAFVALRVGGLAAPAQHGRQEGRDDVIERLLELRRVAAEGHRREEDDQLAAHPALGDLAANVVVYAHAGRRRPALEAAGAPGDLVVAQAPVVDGPAASGQAVGQRVVSQRQGRVVVSAAVQKQGGAGESRVHALVSMSSWSEGFQFSPPARGSAGSCSSLAMVSSHHSM